MLGELYYYYICSFFSVPNYYVHVTIRNQSSFNAKLSEYKTNGIMINAPEKVHSEKEKHPFPGIANPCVSSLHAFITTELLLPFSMICRLEGLASHYLDHSKLISMGLQEHSLFITNLLIHMLKLIFE